MHAWHACLDHPVSLYGLLRCWTPEPAQLYSHICIKTKCDNKKDNGRKTNWWERNYSDWISERSKKNIGLQEAITTACWPAHICKLHLPSNRLHIGCNVWNAGTRTITHACTHITRSLQQMSSLKSIMRTWNVLQIANISLVCIDLKDRCSEFTVQYSSDTALMFHIHLNKFTAYRPIV